MDIRIIEESPAVLAEYEKVSIAFRVESIFRLELLDQGLGGVRMIVESLDKPFIKDYDAHPAERPSNWAHRFDLSNWGILTAFDGERRVGGAAVAWNSLDVLMLDGRVDMACLWDLRVDADYRENGIGRALFQRALEWAKTRNCRVFKVETQNINVPACRFYARQGCRLGAIDRFAYPEPMNEIQLIWYRNI